MSNYGFNDDNEDGNDDMQGYSNAQIGEQGLIGVSVDVNTIQLQLQLQRKNSYFAAAMKAEAMNVLIGELALVMVNERHATPKPAVITKLNGFTEAKDEATAMAYARSCLQFIGITMSDTSDGPVSEGGSSTNGVVVRVRGAFSIWTPYVFKAGETLQWFIPTADEQARFVRANYIHGSEIGSDAITALVRPYRSRNTITEFFKDVIYKSKVSATNDNDLLFVPGSGETEFFDGASVLHGKFADAILGIGVLVLASTTSETDAEALKQRLFDKNDPKSAALRAKTVAQVLGTIAPTPDSVLLDDTESGEAVFDFLVAYDTAVAEAQGRCIATCTAGAAAGKRVHAYL